jgi:hypothetical protein
MLWTPRVKRREDTVFREVRPRVYINVVLQATFSEPSVARAATIRSSWRMVRVEIVLWSILNNNNRGQAQYIGLVVKGDTVDFRAQTSDPEARIWVCMRKDTDKSRGETKSFLYYKKLSEGENFPLNS